MRSAFRHLRAGALIRGMAFVIMVALIGHHGAAQGQAGRSMEARSIAVLQGLDKGTARTVTFSVPVDGTARFGTLTIRVRACQTAPPIEVPESAAFLEIWDQSAGRPSELVFSGWMFASSPALSALEHAVYDVWVVDCRNASTSAVESPAANVALTRSAAASRTR